MSNCSNDKKFKDLRILNEEMDSVGGTDSINLRAKFISYLQGMHKSKEGTDTSNFILQLLTRFSTGEDKDGEFADFLNQSILKETDSIKDVRLTKRIRSNKLADYYFYLKHGVIDSSEAKDKLFNGKSNVIIDDDYFLPKIANDADLETDQKKNTDDVKMFISEVCDYNNRQQSTRDEIENIKKNNSQNNILAEPDVHLKKITIRIDENKPENEEKIKKLLTTKELGCVTFVKSNAPINSDTDFHFNHKSVESLLSFSPVELSKFLYKQNNVSGKVEELKDSSGKSKLIHLRRLSQYTDFFGNNRIAFLNMPIDMDKIDELTFNPEIVPDSVLDFNPANPADNYQNVKILISKLKDMLKDPRMTKSQQILISQAISYF